MTDAEWKQFAKWFGSDGHIYYDFLDYEYICNSDATVWARRYYDDTIVFTSAEVLDGSLCLLARDLVFKL